MGYCECPLSSSFTFSSAFSSSLFSSNLSLSSFFFFHDPSSSPPAFLSIWLYYKWSCYNLLVGGIPVKTWPRIWTGNNSEQIQPMVWEEVRIRHHHFLTPWPCCAFSSDLPSPPSLSPFPRSNIYLLHHRLLLHLLYLCFVILMLFTQFIIHRLLWRERRRNVWPTRKWSWR